MLAHLRAVPWRLDQDAFKAWRQGLTGYPLVDAGGCGSGRVGGGGLGCDWVYVWEGRGGSPGIKRCITSDVAAAGLCLWAGCFNAAGV